MDTTQDISKRDQLSQVYRYVTIQADENNSAKDILIKEAFLGFEETVDTSACELQKKILDSIRSNGFDLSKCRGQGYDSVANMSGVYSGVQARTNRLSCPTEETVVVFHFCVSFLMAMCRLQFVLACMCVITTSHQTASVTRVSTKLALPQH